MEIGLGHLGLVYWIFRLIRHICTHYPTASFAVRCQVSVLVLPFKSGPNATTNSQTSAWLRIFWSFLLFEELVLHPTELWKENQILRFSVAEIFAMALLYLLYSLTDSLTYLLTHGSKLFARNTGRNGWTGQKHKGTMGQWAKGTMGV